MLIGELFIVFVLKPLLICVVIGAILSDLKKESASFRHSIICLSLFFIPVSILFSALHLVSINLQLPVANKVIFYPLSKFTEHEILVVAVFSFISFFLLFYRWLGLYDLFHNERPFNSGPRTLTENINKLVKHYGLRNVNLKKTTVKNHIAYVWGDALLGENRLVISDAFLQLSEQEQLCILNHEIAHIKRRDWLKSECLFLLCALFWWLPPIWKIRKKAEVLAELACDDYLVESMAANQQSPKKIYSQLLLSLNAKAQAQTAGKAITSGETSSDFFQRVVRVLSSYVDRGPVSARSLCVLSVIMALVLSPLIIINVKFTAQNNGQLVATERLPVQTLYIDLDAKSEFEKKDILEITVPKKLLSNSYVDNRDDLPVINSKIPIEELLTRVEFIPAAFDNSLLFPAGNVRVAGFLPTRLLLPEYPEQARFDSLSGEVSVEFFIDEQGHVFNARITDANPMGVFENSVLAVLDDFWFDKTDSGLKKLSFYFDI
ncbi:hypothetical protein MAH1_01370 [Sessilibacter sp. MAH1]